MSPSRTWLDGFLSPQLSSWGRIHVSDRAMHRDSTVQACARAGLHLHNDLPRVGNQKHPFPAARPAGGISERKSVVLTSLASLQQRLVKNRRQIDQTCPLRLLAAGGESSHAMAVRGHDGEDRGAAVAGGIRRGVECGNYRRDAGLAGEVSADAPGKGIVSGRCMLAGGETGLFRHRGESRRPIPAETLVERFLPSYRRPQAESQNGNPGLIPFRRPH